MERDQRLGCLKQAVAITEAYAGSGDPKIPLELVVENVYKKLLELYDDALAKD